VYFDSVTMFVFFLLSGRYLEMMARQKAARSVENLAKALPAFATRLTHWPDASSERIVVAELQPGDTVQISPGETVPADGYVLVGQSATDESLLTGESRPVRKRPDDLLTGGSVNVESPLIMRVERVGDSTRIAAIQRLMERATTEKPELVKAADRIAGRFVIALLVLACMTAVFWWWFDPAQMLWVFVSVLVVSCPCALSLATPAAMTVATGRLAARGVLVTRGHAIESLAAARRFVFDKTGTLTQGQLTLTEVQVLRGDRQSALALAAALEQGSEHAVARAIRNSATESGNPIAPTALTNLHAVTGSGVCGITNEATWRCGRPGFVAKLHDEPVPESVQSAAAAGDVVVALGSTDGWCAFFVLTDVLRPEAASAIQALRRMHLQVSMFSGDASGTAQHVGKMLGIEDVQGALSPEAKHAAMKRLQNKGAVVAMVGDGVNDAPVLAQAHVSIAMGGGTDLARSSADIVLLGNDLAALPEGVRIARLTLRIVRQNLAWSFAYNFLAIPLAMVGWITPWMAGIGMSASSLLVVLNALRLQRL
jgi:Cu2+-exporting ATPase